MTSQMLEYPYPLNLRWNHITWFPVFQKRFLSSSFGRLSDLDVRGAAFTLWSESMYALPPATLPLDEEHLASMLRISQDEWLDLCSRKYPVLHGWVEIQCGDEVKQTHPMLLEALEIAVKAAKLRQRGTTKRLPGTPPDAGRAPH